MQMMNKIFWKIFNRKLEKHSVRIMVISDNLGHFFWHNRKCLDLVKMGYIVWQKHPIMHKTHCSGNNKYQLVNHNVGNLPKKPGCFPCICISILSISQLSYPGFYLLRLLGFATLVEIPFFISWILDRC